MFNAATNTRTWNLTNNGTSTTANIGTTRGMSGPDFDPGYVVSGTSQGGAGLGWVTQGQGRRFLNGTTSGTAIYTTTANNPTGAQQGMTINISPSSTAWRDFAFDPNSGNLYARVNNQVSRTNRTGANTDLSPSGTAGQSDVIVARTGVNYVGTNLGYLDSVAAGTNNTYTGDILVYNDRASNADGQAWTSAILFATTSGSAVSANWNFIGGSAPGTGNAIYDFQWDSASQTLAVVDFTNRTASIFSTTAPAPTAYPTWASSKGLTGSPGFENGKADDPDKDGFNNLTEFALDGAPLSGANDGKVIGKVATVSGSEVFTLTLPVRAQANFPAGTDDRVSDPIDGIVYRIEGDVNLSTFADTISEVTPALDAGLPVLSTGWTYRTFRAPGTIPTVPQAFLRVKISEAP
jgi:hypothetical protein